MGQVLRRTIINVGIHTNGCTVCQKAPEWLGYLVSTDSFLAQCLSGDSAVVLSENKLTFQQVWDFLSFLWETNVLAASADQLWSCCGGLSYTGLGPAILWFCLSVTFFSLVGMLPRLNGFCHCHGGRGIRAWHAKSSETKIHNSVHSSRGRVHDWNQALRSD